MANTTLVLGYFNKHNYPINVNSESLGISVGVPAKGWVVDREGRKINDPRLDAFCRAGLVKEFSTTPVPLVLLNPPQPPPGVGSIPVRGQTATDLQRTPQPPKGALPVSATNPANAVPITAMSIEEARRRGIISAPTKDKFEAAPAEDTSGAAARGAPYIDQAGIRTPVAKNVTVSQLKTVDISSVEGLASDDPVKALTEEAVKSAGLQPAAVAPREPQIPQDAAPAPAPKQTKAPVQYDGRAFTRPGDLRAFLKRKLKDPAAVEEAMSIMLPQFGGG